MEAYSLIDSVFRDSTDGAGRHTLKSYATLHECRLELESATSLLLVSPLQFLRPFRGWRHTVRVWWDAYNRVKHDRIQNYEVASFTCAVTAVAGLHQLLARSWQFLGSLTCAGWFNESSETLAELGGARAAGSGPRVTRSNKTVCQRDQGRLRELGYRSTCGGSMGLHRAGEKLHLGVGGLVSAPSLRTLLRLRAELPGFGIDSSQGKQGHRSPNQRGRTNLNRDRCNTVAI